VDAISRARAEIMREAPAVAWLSLTPVAIHDG
jgi:hypothetical protein